MELVLFSTFWHTGKLAFPSGHWLQRSRLICCITAEWSLPNFGFCCRSISQNSRSAVTSSSHEKLQMSQVNARTRKRRATSAGVARNQWIPQFAVEGRIPETVVRVWTTRWGQSGSWHPCHIDAPRWQCLLDVVTKPAAVPTLSNMIIAMCNVSSLCYSLREHHQSYGWVVHECVYKDVMVSQDGSIQSWWHISEKQDCWVDHLVYFILNIRSSLSITIVKNGFVFRKFSSPYHNVRRFCVIAENCVQYMDSVFRVESLLIMIGNQILGRKFLFYAKCTVYR